MNPARGSLINHSVPVADHLRENEEPSSTKYLQTLLKSTIAILYRIKFFQRTSWVFPIHLSPTTKHWQSKCSVKVNSHLRTSASTKFTILRLPLHVTSIHYLLWCVLYCFQQFAVAGLNTCVDISVRTAYFQYFYRAHNCAYSKWQTQHRYILNTWLFQVFEGHAIAKARNVTRFASHQFKFWYTAHSVFSETVVLKPTKTQWYKI